MTGIRIVQRSSGVWIVRSREQGRDLTQHKSQKDAIAAATESLRARGGRVQVFGLDGSLKRSIQVDGSVRNPADVSHARWSYRIGMGGIVISVLALAVSIVLAIFGSKWSEMLTQEPVVNRLVTLHAGNNLASIDDAIGAATLTQRLEGPADWKRTIYVRDDFAVSAITGDDDKIVVLTLLVCGGDFDAAIETPAGTTLHLRDQPLADAEQSDFYTNVNDRDLNYISRATGSSLPRLQEFSASDPASGSNWLDYAVGYSSACGPLPETVARTLFDDGFIGKAAAAPPEVKEFRASHPPNYYTEMDLNDWNLSVDDIGLGVFSSAEPQSTVIQENVPLTFIGGGDIPTTWPRD